MAAQHVSTCLLREALEEAEQECTLERFQVWYRHQIARELQRVPRPRPDKWDTWGNRNAECRFREECERIIKVMWEAHRKVVREQGQRIAEAHFNKYGDAMLMQGGGSSHDMLVWMLKVAGSSDGHMPQYCPCTGNCACERERRMQELATRREAVERMLADTAFADALDRELDRLATEEVV